jgi:hypothetical protein
MGRDVSPGALRTPFTLRARGHGGCYVWVSLG